MGESVIRVRVEFKRVQTFLFEVPRLRAMVGANVLLGELLRYELTQLYLSLQDTPPKYIASVALATTSQPPSDPLAEALNAYWRKQQIPNFQAQFDARFPSIPATGRDWLVDDPANAYRHGVLARDGGHFSVLFDDEKNARIFSGQARDRAAELTPGIRLEVHIDEWAPGDAAARRNWKPIEAPEKLEEFLMFQLPVFARCPELPNLPADDEAEYWTGDELKREPMSHPAALRYRYGKRYLRHELIPEGERSRTDPVKGTDMDDAYYTLDMASLLRPQLPFWDSAQRPPDFNAIAGGGYMAVIHMDGNGMGNRSKPFRDAADRQEDFAAWLGAEFQIENLFHQARVLMRCALAQAMKATFGDENLRWCRDGTYLRPYQVLMMGGDDVLLVCRADKALPLVAEFAKALQSLQKEGGFLAFKGNPLTIGSGVVIAKPNLPFHRLHELAEGLASSAKALFRSLPKDAPASVVDWMVTSNAWADDAASERATSDVVELGLKRRLLLSCKPYRILEDTGSPEESSLQSMLVAACKLKEKLSSEHGAARNQLKSLDDHLARGEALGRLAWRQLPKETREALVEAGVGHDSTPWDTVQTVDGIDYVPTRALDAVEIVEIDKLGQQNRWSGKPASRPAASIEEAQA